MQPPRFLIVALWLSSNVARSAQECRNEYKKLRPTHTACKPANKECTINKKGVSAAERQLILKTHNDYRSTVTTGKLRGFPPAANMRQLEWNEELASVAQAKAQQCTDSRGTLKHDSPEERFITEFNKTGQNLAFRRSNIAFNGTDWPAQVKAWFDGHSHYSPSNVNRFSSPSESPAGHFTQVVWATARYVGCGYVDYAVAGVSVMPHMQLYVCNYAGAGNVLTLPVYQAGEVCSACPNDTACAQDTGLCTLSTVGGAADKGREMSFKGSHTPHAVPGATGKRPGKPKRHRSLSDAGFPFIRRNGGPTILSPSWRLASYVIAACYGTSHRQRASFT
ncbi:scoloptoxin SSD976-like [Dermacentor albipictus]|uniref:scoloptoxin SSD976-like n=1 Tax=Dermacentor albipictus TaxID=60249 RepID=UPI0038FC1B7F